MFFRRSALQAQINIAIRINAAIFVEISKGNKIFNSKVHYFMVKNQIKLITSLQQKI
jgi:hypothetical protein